MARIYIRAFAINLLCNNVSPYSGRQSGGADQQTRQGQVLVQVELSQPGHALVLHPAAHDRAHPWRRRV